MPASHVSFRQNILAQIVHLCVTRGLTNVVISPGSRSAPLTAAFAANPAFQRRVIYDERSAGYLALGIAQQTGRPAVLICTSGTAALNYAPAVAEAFYQQIPLLVFTADRPPEWIDQQDNQAIHQRSLYAPHVRASYELPVDFSHADSRWHALRTVNEAIDQAGGLLPGPVHINVPLREPLYPELARSTRSGVQAKIENDPDPWRASFPGLPGSEEREAEEERGTGHSVVEIAPSRPRLTAEAWDELLRRWSVATRKLIVAGMHPPDAELRRALQRLSQQPDVAVIADITANLFPDGTPLHHGDAILGTGHQETLHALQPDLVISFGGPVTSKYVKQFLRSSAPQAHWRVQPAGVAPDTYQNLTHLLPMMPGDFFAELAQRVHALPAVSDYADIWQHRETATAQRSESFLRSASFGEFQAVWRVMQALPPGSRLQVGNSMPIRYANLIGHASPDALGSVHSNRGVSGIDGAVSTAVGAALAYGDLTTLIVGDLGFFYDRNGLWHPHVPANLRIVLLNNHGGGIFDIIDGPDSLPRALHETYFLTPQPLTAERTAADHGVDYLHAADAASLDTALADFFSPRPRAALLEIETDMATNSQVFRLFKAIIAQLT